MNGLRNFLPELLALSASSPFVENVNTGLHSARTQIFTRFFPRCGVPTRTRAGTSTSATCASSTTRGSITEHTQLWWSVRPHLAFPTVEIRICDGQPDLGEAQSLAALRRRSPPASRARYDEGEPVEPLPHRLIEENFWRAIRYGLSGELIDFGAGRTIPARRGSKSWSSGCSGRGGDRRRAVPRGARANAAERQIERFERARLLRRSMPSR